MAKKVLFTATLVRGHIAKFHIPYLKWFKEQGWETWVAAKNDYPDGVCAIPYCDHFVNIDFPRSPFTTQLFTAYSQIRELLSHEKFELIHTHTPVGSVLTRVAAGKARVHGTKVIYTAHGFHFYDGAPLLNWLLWFPVEKAMSKRTDLLLTINKEDYQRAKGFSKCRVECVPGVGVDLSVFDGCCSGEEVKRELGLPSDTILLLSVGDLIKRKNQGVIIRSLSLLDRRVELAICGEGPEREALEALAKQWGVDGRVHFLGFRNDIPRLMSGSDVFVFPSIHEGLPISVIEAMSSGLPVIASSIRGIKDDLIIDGENGLLLSDGYDENELADIVKLICGDEETASELSGSAIASVRKYDIASCVDTYAALYQEMMRD